MKTSYVGSCHCGAVSFEAQIDLDAGTIKCDCPICVKTSMWGAVVGADDLRMIRGADDLKDYQPDNAHHVFCTHCGVRPFGWWDEPEAGRFYAELSKLPDPRMAYSE
jgi:hypothetical protein